MGSPIASAGGVRPIRRRRSVGAAILVLGLVATACGTRLEEDQLHAAARGTGPVATEATAADGSDIAGNVPTGASTDVATPDPDTAEAGGPAAGTGGSTGGTTGGATGGATGAATGGATGGAPVAAQCTGQKKPITIASVGNFSGVLGAIITQATQVISAWAASVNAKGGVACHPIKYIVHDDGGDPARNQALIRQSVEQQGAIAFVYLGSPIAGAASVDYIQRNRIPVIGEEGGNPWSCVNSMYFPIMTACGDAIDGSYIVLKKVVKKGDRVGAMACIEVPFCSGWGERAPKAAQIAGMTVVSNQGVSLAQPDYTSPCIAARDAKSQVMVLGIDSNSMIRIQRSCRSVGLDVPHIGPGSAYSTDAASKPDLRNAWAASGVRFGPADHPGVAKMVQTVKQYGPSIKTLAPNGAIGWVAAQVFELAAQNVSDNPTSAEILEGLWSIKNNDIGGMTKPLTFRKDQPVPAGSHCVFALEIAEGAWHNREKVCW